MEVIKGVKLDIPFFVPKFIFYIKRRNLLNINFIHYLDIKFSFFAFFKEYKKTGEHKVPTRQTNVLD